MKSLFLFLFAAEFRKIKIIIYSFYNSPLYCKNTLTKHDPGLFVHPSVEILKQLSHQGVSGNWKVLQKAFTLCRDAGRQKS